MDALVEEKRARENELLAQAGTLRGDVITRDRIIKEMSVSLKRVLSINEELKKGRRLPPMPPPPPLQRAFDPEVLRKPKDEPPVEDTGASYLVGGKAPAPRSLGTPLLGGGSGSASMREPLIDPSHPYQGVHPAPSQEVDSRIIKTFQAQSEDILQLKGAVATMQQQQQSFVHPGQNDKTEEVSQFIPKKPPFLDDKEWAEELRKAKATDPPALSGLSFSQVPLVPAKRKDLKADKFRGEDWQSFRTQFERVARHNRWFDMGDDVMLTQLLNSLDGAPKRYILTYMGRDEMSYNTVMTILQEKYAPPDLQERYRIEVSSRKQRQGESLDDFATSLQELVAKAFPEMTDRLLSDTVVRYFREGILDPILKKKIWEYLPNTSTLNEHLSYGRRITAADEQLQAPRQKIVEPAYVGHIGGSGEAPAGTKGKSRKGKPSSGANPDPVTKAIDNLSKGLTTKLNEEFKNQQQQMKTWRQEMEKRMSVLTEPPSSSARAPSGNRGGHCYRCGSPAHWIGECPYPPAEQDRERTFNNSRNRGRGGGNSNRG